MRQGDVAVAARPRADDIDPAHGFFARLCLDDELFGSRGASSLHPVAPPRMLFAAAVDAVDAERFLAVEGGHDAGDGAGEQGLARTGRAGHEDVVSAAAGDLDGALDVLLAADVGEGEGDGGGGGAGGGSVADRRAQDVGMAIASRLSCPD